MSYVHVVVGYRRSLSKYDDRKKYPMGDPDCLVLFGHVSADMGGYEPPAVELTQAEMQSVAYAAKMAFAKVLAKRKKR